MKIFKELNKEGVCGICGKNSPGACILIPIDGSDEGNLVQGVQVHLECIELRLNTANSESLIYQFVEKLHV